jgi:hypothetical protein
MDEKMHHTVTSRRDTPHRYRSHSGTLAATVMVIIEMGASQQRPNLGL